MTRPYDLILHGATGYTGALVAEHLFNTYGEAGPLNWAISGRSQAKLDAVKAQLGARTLPTLIADATDPASLKALAESAKVIISTVGPYQLYGGPLVAACAAAGTDYVDLTGESHWIAQMIAAHDETAKKTGARLVFSCGFDSIPFDLGVFVLQQEAQKRLGKPLPRVKGRVTKMRGGLSGGTLASGMATMAAARQDPSLGKLLANPFALTPGFQGPQQPDDSKPYQDPALGDAWVGPFMMAAINTKAVHRTNHLLGRPWGDDFKYDEMLVLDTPPPADGAGAGGGGQPGSTGFDFGGNMPSPGEGPTKAEREAGFYDLAFIGEDETGKPVLTVHGHGDKDPGYGSTSKILAEAALVLMDTPRDQTPGGCWTPAAAMGEGLVVRLRERAGLRFEVG